MGYGISVIEQFLVTLKHASFSNILPEKDHHHSPSAIWGHHLNHAWQIVSKHTAFSNTTSNMLGAMVFYK